MVKVLFICMGNICRSPTAHGVFQQRVVDAGLDDKIFVDSAGTHSYHIGNQPDERSQAAALQRGYDLSDQQAQKLISKHGAEFDYLLVMDDTNYHDASDILSSDGVDKLEYFLSYQSGENDHVPDPYYGGEQGFEDVLDMVEEASDSLLEHIKRKHKL